MGAKSVGKTTALASFMGQDITKTKATISMACSTRTFPIGPGKAIVIDFLDTQGVDMSTNIPTNFYRGSQGIICMFDITSRESFEHLKTLVKTVYEKTQIAQVQVMLVGNKLDLSSARQVRTKEGEAFAREHDCDYFEVSVIANRAGVDAVFQRHVETITQVFCSSGYNSARSEAPLLTPRHGEAALKLSMERNQKDAPSSSCNC